MFRNSTLKKYFKYCCCWFLTGRSEHEQKIRALYNMLAEVGSIFNKNGLPPRREEWQWAMRSVPSLWLRTPLPAAHRHHRVRKFQQRIVENTQREVLPTTMRDDRDALTTPQITPYFKGVKFSLQL